ncbi:hypothetical protein VYU27_006695 [Nannochloropsis oceanica]
MATTVMPSTPFFVHPPAHPPVQSHQEGDSDSDEEVEHLQEEEENDEEEGEGPVVPWWAQQLPQAPAEEGGRSDQQQHQQQQQQQRQHESGRCEGSVTYLLRQLFFPLLRPLSAALKKAQGHAVGQQHQQQQQQQHPHHHGERSEDGSYTRQEQQQKKKNKKDEDEGRMVHLDGPSVYSCCMCRTHLATDMEVVSRAFHGRGGRAFLLDKVVNISPGPSEQRMLMTGLHSVSDLRCATCHTVLGWQYDKAFEPSQKYKEGKFVLEMVHVRLEEEEEEEEAEW